MTDKMMTNELTEARKKRIDEKAAVTAKVSDITRFVAFGLLAIFYTINSGESKFAQELQNQRFCIYLVGVLSSSAILLDYLQYLCGVQSVEKALRDPNYLYDDKSWWYWWRENLFGAKQILVTISAILLVFIVGAAFFRKAL